MDAGSLEFRCQEDLRTRDTRFSNCVSNRLLVVIEGRLPQHEYEHLIAHKEESSYSIDVPITQLQGGFDHLLNGLRVASAWNTHPTAEEEQSDLDHSAKVLSYPP